MNSERKTVLTIAGSDSSGGAGIQADLKTMTAHGVYGMSVITALTAQNTVGVRGVLDTPPEFVAQQMDCVFQDIRPDAVKIGMVSNAAIIAVIAEKLREYRAENVVIDPVMVATSGGSLMQSEAVQTLIRELLPLAAVITPNLEEGEVLSGRIIRSKEDMQEACIRITEQMESMWDATGAPDPTKSDGDVRRRTERSIKDAMHSRMNQTGGRNREPDTDDAPGATRDAQHHQDRFGCEGRSREPDTDDAPGATRDAQHHQDRFGCEGRSREPDTDDAPGATRDAQCHKDRFGCEGRSREPDTDDTPGAARDAQCHKDRFGCESRNPKTETRKLPAILLKGGHLTDRADDLLYLPETRQFIWLEGAHIDNPNTHGTGCTLSSAIACGLAEGKDIAGSVRTAKEYVAGAIRAGLNLGRGRGPLDHMYSMKGRNG